MARDFDELLLKYGGHGTYQRKMLALVVCPMSFLVGMAINLTLFQMAVPDHWCYIPGRERTTLSAEEWKNITIPLNEKGEFSSCSSYVIEWREKEVEGVPFIVHNETQGCGNKWDYDTSEFTSTWATDFGWFCGKEYYPSLIFSARNLGSCIGTFIFPVISDKYTGRRVMFYALLCVVLVFTTPLIWISDFTAHFILRLLAGTAHQSYFNLPYVIVLEVLLPQKRAAVHLLVFLLWSIGMCFASLVAWLIPQWHYLLIIALTPAVFGFLYWRYLPESPRWLLAQGKISECADVVMKIAKVNRKPMPPLSDLKMELLLLKNSQKEDLSLTHAFKYPRLRRYTIILILLSMATYLPYSMTLLIMNVLDTNYFLSHFVVSVFQVPSNFIGWGLAQYLGRRFCLFSTIVCTAISALAACFCINDKWALLISVGFVKMFSTQFMYSIYTLVTELLPTTIRTTGFSWMVVFGLLSAMLAPYPLQNELSATFPYILIIAIMMLSLVIGWTLPETIGLPLPQTFEDSEKLHIGRPLKAWINHWNYHNYSSHIGEASKENMTVTEEEKTIIKA